jgi:hypothetical protein
VVRFKARLVAKGFAQKQGVDYNETFASVVKFTSIRMVLALATLRGHAVYHLDVKTAFLNGELDEVIYMEQPHEFDDGSGRVLELQKSLYGLKQSPRQWYIKLREVMEKLGFTRTNADHSIFIFRRGEDEITLPTYVDDMIGSASSPEVWREFVSSLARHFDITDLGLAVFALGVKIDQNLERGTIRISQRSYIDNILKSLGYDEMGQHRKVGTPLPPNIHLTKDSSPQNAEEAEEMKHIPYLQTIGQLMYLMLWTRPDLCHAIGVLSRFGANPGPEHWSALKHVLRYVASTRDYGITYSKKNTRNEVVAYSDADWAKDRDTRRSTTGMLVTLAGGALSWKSKLQPTTAQSTLEAEYMAASSTSREVMWLRQLYCDLVGPLDSPTILYCDNNGAIATTKDQVFHDRSKHIDVKYHYIRERQEDKDIEVKYLSTKNMAADCLTKSLPRIKLEECLKLMGLGSGGVLE